MLQHSPENKHSRFRMPEAPRSILKGSSLKDLLGPEAIDCLRHNLTLVYPSFDGGSFQRATLKDIAPLGILDRGMHLAQILRQYLPDNFEKATDVLLRSLTPPLTRTDELGLGVFFYLPHVSFIAKYGLDRTYNGDQDSFEVAMRAQYELTQRFSAEFSMRVFLIHRQEETLARLLVWTKDRNSHVRRLCSEGSRPRLPWAMRIPAFIKNPALALPILEALKDDCDLYVRRSVANHLGDMAKDSPEFVFRLCEKWLVGASNERRWLIRHALRHPSKKGHPTALDLRKRAMV